MRHTGGLPDAEYTVRDQERMADATKYFAWQSRLVTRELGNRVLEIGCGVGNFTKHILDRELVVGIDVEQECIAAGRQAMGERPNLITRQMDVLDPEFAGMRRYRFDSIVCLNVLEHISDDELALRHMAKVLSDGGTVVLLVPACESLYGPIDKNLGHYRRYSKKLVRKLAAATGFEVAKLRYMNSVGFLGWWLNARVLKRQEQSSGQIAVFDRWIVPALSVLESEIEPPFGQSLFVVLVKHGRQDDAVPSGLPGNAIEGDET
jgi:SAM-dependent methyltransferase